MECMCAQTLDLGLYFHPKEFWGNRVRAYVNSKGNIPTTGKNSPQRRIEPTTLHQAGQRARYSSNELLQPHCPIPKHAEHRPKGFCATCRSSVCRALTCRKDWSPGAGRWRDRRSWPCPKEGSSDTCWCSSSLTTQH